MRSFFDGLNSALEMRYDDGRSRKEVVESFFKGGRGCDLPRLGLTSPGPWQREVA